MMVPQSQPPEAIVGSSSGGSRDMWFHHPSHTVQALPLTATVPRLPNGMERKAGRAYRSVLDLVVAACTAALAGAMSVVPPDPRRLRGPLGLKGWALGRLRLNRLKTDPGRF